MTIGFPLGFAQQYDSHLKHLKLKGLQPKTIDAYARAIRRLGKYFDYRIDYLSEAQLTEYFSDLIGTHSWSAVKLDLYGLKFFTVHVPKKAWVMPHLIKPPKSQRLPDIVTVDEAQRLFSATRVLSYRVFYFTLYSLGLRLGEGLALKVVERQAIVSIAPFRKNRHISGRGCGTRANKKGLIALLQIVLRVKPRSPLAEVKPRPKFLCPCCGVPMTVKRRRIRPDLLDRRRSTDLPKEAVR